MELSVCIVNWNTREHLRRCLLSLRANAAERASWEILVVDNASRDGSGAMVRREFPEAILIENTENVGYARANNQLIEASQGENLLFLNPDVEVKPGALAGLLELMRSDGTIGAVAPRLLNPDGSVQHSCRAFPSLDVLLNEFLGLSRLFRKSKTFGKYRLSWWGYDEVMEVEQPMASALLLRRRALEQVGGFDEDFPIFFNDVDLCYRLRRAGWKILFTPQAEMIHYLGASTAQMKDRIRESHRSLCLFLRKHYRGEAGLVRYALAIVLVWIGQWARLAGSYVAGQWWKTKRVNQ